MRLIHALLFLFAAGLPDHTHADEPSVYVITTYYAREDVWKPKHIWKVFKKYPQVQRVANLHPPGFHKDVTYAIGPMREWQGYRFYHSYELPDEDALYNGDLTVVDSPLDQMYRISTEWCARPDTCVTYGDDGFVDVNTPNPFVFPAFHDAWKNASRADFASKPDKYGRHEFQDVPYQDSVMDLLTVSVFESENRTVTQFAVCIHNQGLWEFNAEMRRNRLYVISITESITIRANQPRHCRKR